MVNYPLGNYLIAVKNASLAGRDEIVCQSTKLIVAMAKALEKEGFLNDIKVTDGNITAKIAKSHKKPVLMDLKLISKPGLRVYRSVADMQKRKARSSMLFLSTPKGIMSDKAAIKQNLGGEIIVEVM